MVKYLPSRSLRRLPIYPFAVLNAVIEQKRSEGVSVISLGIGDPDLPPPPEVARAITSALADAATYRYPTNRGTEAFRDAVVEFYDARFGVALDARHEVMPVLGAKEGVAHLCQTFLDPQDLALAPEPGYPLYRVSPALVGAEAVHLPLLEEHDYFPQLEEVSPQAAQRARILFVNYPNNPTGATVPEGAFATAVEWCAEHEVLLVHDAAYTELSYDGARAPSVLCTPGAKEVAVEVFSLSKGWSLCGLRVGAIVGSAEVIDTFHRLKSNIDQGMPGIAQAAAVAALRACPDHPATTHAVYRRRADLMAGALRAMGIAAEPPRATPYMWVRCPDGVKSVDFAHAVLEESAVVVTPGTAFGPSGEGYFRISLTTDDETLEEAASRLASVVLAQTA